MKKEWVNPEIAEMEIKNGPGNGNDIFDQEYNPEFS